MDNGTLIITELTIQKINTALLALAERIAKLEQRVKALEENQ